MEEISDETPQKYYVHFSPKAEWCIQQTKERKINMEVAEYEYDCLFYEDGTPKDN
jgi:hypothetical protein